METIELIRKKLIDEIELKRVCARAKFLNKKIVFTNGCFDILHRGHVEYLAKAADMGDILIVGLNSDESVRRIKGNDRPIQDQETRSLILSSLQFIDYVVIFHDDTPLKLIETIQPDVLVKGGDYTEIEKIVGYHVVTKKGGKVITIPFVEGYSTTLIINKIISL